jgi:REP element-mobilizing transposase RayT
MPDHAHILVEGQSSEADLRGLVVELKQRSGRSHRTRAGEGLWQRGYHDRVLRENDRLSDFVEYVLGNPLRAGLASFVGEHPFTGTGDTLQGICAGRTVPDGRAEARPLLQEQ